MDIREVGQIDFASELGPAVFYTGVESGSLECAEIEDSIQNLRDDLARVGQLIRVLEWLASGEERAAVETAARRRAPPL